MNRKIKNGTLVKVIKEVGIGTRKFLNEIAVIIDYDDGSFGLNFMDGSSLHWVNQSSVEILDNENLYSVEGKKLYKVTKELISKRDIKEKFK